MEYALGAGREVRSNSKAPSRKQCLTLLENVKDVDYVAAGESLLLGGFRL